MKRDAFGSICRRTEGGGRNTVMSCEEWSPREAWPLQGNHRVQENTKQNNYKSQSCTVFHLTRGENSSINNKSKQSTLTCFTACAVSSGSELKRILGENFFWAISWSWFLHSPQDSTTNHGQENIPFLSWAQVSGSLWLSTFNTFLNFLFLAIMKKNPET